MTAPSKLTLHRLCMGCGRGFKTGKKHKLYCSAVCRNKAGWRKYVERSLLEQAAAEGRSE